MELVENAMYRIRKSISCIQAPAFVVPVRICPVGDDADSGMLKATFQWLPAFKRTSEFTLNDFVLKINTGVCVVEKFVAFE